MSAGEPAGLMPTGLGSRDSLRLEMGYALYGNDLDEDHSYDPSEGEGPLQGAIVELYEDTNGNGALDADDKRVSTATTFSSSTAPVSRSTVTTAAWVP